MPGHDIIVMGASAGGVESLQQLIEGLPSDLPASLFIVLHLAPDGVSALPNILNRKGILPAEHAKDGQKIEHGRIYVASPDYHMVLNRGFIRLLAGPRENHSRPAVDPLFRSAARAYGNRVVGVILFYRVFSMTAPKG